MKKVICLILALIMTVSMVSCGDIGGLNNAPVEETTEVVTEAPTTEAATTEEVTTEAATTEEVTTEEVTTEEVTTEEVTTEEVTTEEATTEEITTEEITTEEVTTEEVTTEEEVFRAGYSRVKITPSAEVLAKEGYTKVGDDIYATCLAVYDGETTAIFISLDMGSLMEDGNDMIRNKVSSVTKVPKSNIFIAVTHTHSSVGISAEAVWTFTTCTNIANSAKAAINDLADAEIHVGVGETPGMAFVRRYVMADGSMTSINPGKGGAVKCVAEADDSLQVVRFVREDKKDIVLPNWQGHFAHAINMDGEALSADITHYLREDIEAADPDALVIYFAGASGNLNLTPPNNAAKKYENYIAVAHALAEETLEVMKDLEKIESGKINITKQTYKAKNADDPESVVEASQARKDAGTNTSADNYILARNKNDYSNVRMSAISIGDLALVTAPYEMFDTNGMTIKEESPFKMTIVITNSDGAFAYIPSYEAFTVYGGYETETTYFAAGMGEELVAEYLKMLTALSESN